MPYSPPPELRDLSLSDIAKLSKNRKLPPVDQWNPQNSSDSKMQIMEDGRWFHDGGEIKRASMVRAFSSLLRKDDDGYWLVTPHEKQSIIVDDAPFIAVEMNSSGSGQNRNIIMRMNMDEIITIDHDHIIIMRSIAGAAPIPYVHVRDGLMAKCARNVAYELYEIAIAEGNDETATIWSGGTMFDLNVT